MEKKKPHPDTTLAIIPMGIPGIGKSRVFESLLKNPEATSLFHFESVSSDDIRKECMDKYLATHAGADSEDAFKGTQGAYKGAFYKALGRAATKTVPGKIRCIIVDKNHPGNGISSSVEYTLFARSGTGEKNNLGEFITNWRILDISKRLAWLLMRAAI